MNSCRFCREQIEDLKQPEILHPCRCSGTMKYIHKDCLNQWRNYGDGKNKQKCSVCNTRYQFASSNLRNKLILVFLLIVSGVIIYSYSFLTLYNFLEIQLLQNPTNDILSYVYTLFSLYKGLVMLGLFLGLLSGVLALIFEFFLDSNEERKFNYNILNFLYVFICAVGCGCFVFWNAVRLAVKEQWDNYISDQREVIVSLKE